LNTHRPLQDRASGTEKVAVLFTNAYHLGFPSNSFDIALSGFMGWYDCFDFERNEFTQPDKKPWRSSALRKEAGSSAVPGKHRMIWHSWKLPCFATFQISFDREYIEQRPIGMAYEKLAGYEIILKTAGFRDIDVSRRQRSLYLPMRKNGGSR
jgi:hypothetical protein